MINTNIFNFDFKKMARWFTPLPLRKTGFYAAINAAMAGIVFNYQLFLRNRAANLYRLKITPQFCYLCKMLNDRYDFTQRRIYVLNGVMHNPIYLFQEAELKDKFIYLDSENQPLTLWTDGEAGAITDDFVVFVPGSISFNMAEMIGLINIYCLPGKNFKIELV